MWVGLLYDQTALDAAWDRVKHWTIEEREALRHAVPSWRSTRRSPAAGRCATLPREVLDIASAGLSRARRLNAAGDNEGGFLDPLREVVASGMTPADRLLDKYQQ